MSDSTSTSINSSTSGEKMTTIERAFRTVREMLVDREMLEDAKMMEAYDAKLNDMRAAEAVLLQIPLKTVTLVFFTQTHTPLKSFRQEFEETNMSYIMVLFDKPNQGLNKELKEIEVKQRKEQFINLFTYKQLLFNPTHHVLVPRHVKLSPEQVQKLLQDHTLKTCFALPWIQSHDPIAQYLGLKPSDVVKITRDSTTSCEFDSYRCCV